MFEPTPKQFGVFWEFIENPTVTDIDYNGRELWITDLKKVNIKRISLCPIASSQHLRIILQIA